MTVEAGAAHLIQHQEQAARDSSSLLLGSLSASYNSGSLPGECLLPGLRGISQHQLTSNPSTLPDPQLLQQLCTHDPGDPGPGSRACLISILPHIFRSNKAKHSTVGAFTLPCVWTRCSFCLEGRTALPRRAPLPLPCLRALIQPSAPFPEESGTLLYLTQPFFCFCFPERQSPISLNLSSGRFRPFPTLELFVEERGSHLTPQRKHLILSLSDDRACI